VVLETFLVARFASFRKTKTLIFGGYEKTRLFALKNHLPNEHVFLEKHPARRTFVCLGTFWSISDWNPGTSTSNYYIPGYQRCKP
jgi:hypothetical protein